RGGEVCRGGVGPQTPPPSPLPETGRGSQATPQAAFVGLIVLAAFIVGRSPESTGRGSFGGAVDRASIFRQDATFDAQGRFPPGGPAARQFVVGELDGEHLGVAVDRDC